MKRYSCLLAVLLMSCGGADQSALVPVSSGSLQGDAIVAPEVVEPVAVPAEQSRQPAILTVAELVAEPVVVVSQPVVPPVVETAPVVPASVEPIVEPVIAPTITPVTVIEDPTPDVDNNAIPFIDKPEISGIYRASSTWSLPEDCPTEEPDCERFLMMGINLEVKISPVESAVGYGLFLRSSPVENYTASDLSGGSVQYDVRHRIIETGTNADVAALQAYLDESVYQADAYDVLGNGSGLTDPVVWVRGND